MFKEEVMMKLDLNMDFKNRQKIIIIIEYKKLVAEYIQYSIYLNF